MWVPHSQQGVSSVADTQLSKQSNLLHKPISTYKYMNAVYSPWRCDDDDSSHDTPVAFNRIFFYCDNFPTCFPQKSRKICNTGKPNSICSESCQQCSRVFWVTIYLEYNTAEWKTKILTCLRLAQALLLPPGVTSLFKYITHYITQKRICVVNFSGCINIQSSFPTSMKNNHATLCVDSIFHTAFPYPYPAKKELLILFSVNLDFLSGAISMKIWSYFYLLF